MSSHPIATHMGRHVRLLCACVVLVVELGAGSFVPKLSGRWYLHVEVLYQGFRGFGNILFAKRIIVVKWKTCYDTSVRCIAFNMPYINVQLRFVWDGLYSLPRSQQTKLCYRRVLMSPSAGENTAGEPLNFRDCAEIVFRYIRYIRYTGNISQVFVTFFVSSGHTG